jgi:L-ascorbate metabolism protein UlaG (beta-lactamase superfamily)
MEITYLGHSCFKLKSKSGLVLYMDPYKSEIVGQKLPKDVADIVTISHDHEDHNCREVITGAINRESTFVIEKEGEYEIAGILITATKSYHDKTEGSERGKNLIVSVVMDEVNVVHLGDLGHKLSESQVERMGEVHALMIPVGGKYTMSSEEVFETIKEIQPSYVIPMHYGVGEIEPALEGIEKLDKFMEKNKLPLAGESVHKIKLELGALPDDTQVLLMNA